MPYPYVIYADMAADLPVELAKEQDIRFIPMHYTLSEQERTCTGMEDPQVLKQFYDTQRRGELTRTSQIPPQVYVDLFAPILESGRSVLYISLSSALSGTYQSSCIAASELNDQHANAQVYCVDSRSASGGIGLLLEAAAENRAAGMSPEENVLWLENHRHQVCHWLMVDDLIYLKRGGRISAATALVGSTLNIKPILRIGENGSLDNFAKVRGHKAGLKKLVSLYAATATPGNGQRIYVIHGDDPESAAFLVEELRKIDDSCPITTVLLNPVIGAHTGPGLCAIVNWGDGNTQL